VRIAFFGLPIAALLLARDGHRIAYASVVPGGGMRRLSRGRGRGSLGERDGFRVDVLPDLASDAAFDRVREARPDLLVSWFWLKAIPPRVLALAPSVGVHPSLLPRHRGPDPYFWAIDQGDAVTGVTAHALEERYDTGPVYAQRSLDVAPTWNAWQLARALDRPSLALLREVVQAFAEGRPPAARPQEEAAATAAPQPTDEDLAVRWTWPADRIERRVRAAAPWPGAWTEIGEEVVVLVRVRPTRDFPQALAAGEAAVRADGVAVVRAGDGALELLEGRAEDDASRLTTDDLARVVERARGPAE
jgi:methionyl-tRNA formyltransferase